MAQDPDNAIVPPPPGGVGNSNANRPNRGAANQQRGRGRPIPTYESGRTPTGPPNRNQHQNFGYGQRNYHQNRGGGRQNPNWQNQFAQRGHPSPNLFPGRQGGYISGRGSGQQNGQYRNQAMSSASSGSNAQRNNQNNQAMPNTSSGSNAQRNNPNNQQRNQAMPSTSSGSNAQRNNQNNQQRTISMSTNNSSQPARPVSQSSGTTTARPVDVVVTQPSDTTSVQSSDATATQSTDVNESQTETKKNKPTRRGGKDRMTETKLKKLAKQIRRDAGLPVSSDEEPTPRVGPNSLANQSSGTTTAQPVDAVVTQPADTTSVQSSDATATQSTSVNESQTETKKYKPTRRGGKDRMTETKLKRLAKQVRRDAGEAVSSDEEPTTRVGPNSKQRRQEKYRQNIAKAKHEADAAGNAVAAEPGLVASYERAMDERRAADAGEPSNSAAREMNIANDSPAAVPTDDTQTTTEMSDIDYEIEQYAKSRTGDPFHEGLRSLFVTENVEQRIAKLGKELHRKASGISLNDSPSPASRGSPSKLTPKSTKTSPSRKIKSPIQSVQGSPFKPTPKSTKTSPKKENLAPDSAVFQSPEKSFGINLDDDFTGDDLQVSNSPMIQTHRSTTATNERIGEIIQLETDAAQQIVTEPSQASPRQLSVDCVGMDKSKIGSESQTSKSDSGGRTNNSIRDIQARPTSRSDSGARTNNSIRDIQARPTSKSVSDGRTNNAIRDIEARPTSRSDSGGRTNNVIQDVQARPTSKSVSDGRTNNAIRDIEARPTSRSDSGGRTNNVIQDVRARPTSKSVSNGRTNNAIRDIRAREINSQSKNQVATARLEEIRQRNKEFTPKSDSAPKSLNWLIGIGEQPEAGAVAMQETEAEERALQDDATEKEDTRQLRHELPRSASRSPMVEPQNLDVEPTVSRGSSEIDKRDSHDLLRRLSRSVSRSPKITKSCVNPQTKYPTPPPQDDDSELYSTDAKDELAVDSHHELQLSTIGDKHGHKIHDPNEQPGHESIDSTFNRDVELLDAPSLRHGSDAQDEPAIDSHYEPQLSTIDDHAEQEFNEADRQRYHGSMGRFLSLDADLGPTDFNAPFFRNGSKTAKRSSMVLSDSDPTDRIESEQRLFAPLDVGSERGSMRAPSPMPEEDEDVDEIKETPRTRQTDPLTLPTPKVTGAFVHTPATVKVEQQQSVAGGLLVPGQKKSASTTNLASTLHRNFQAGGRRARSLSRARSPLVNSTLPPSASDDVREIKRLHQIDDPAADATLDDVANLKVDQKEEEEEDDEKANDQDQAAVMDKMTKMVTTGLLGIQTARQGIERLERSVSHPEKSADLAVKHTEPALPACASTSNLVTYVSVPVPRLFFWKPAFRPTILGLILLVLGLWFCAESTTCAAYCKPTVCYPGDVCAWSPEDPTFGYSIPVKFDQWSTGGRGRGLANRVLQDVADVAADVWDVLTDTSMADHRRQYAEMSLGERRQYRRRLDKLGGTKTWPLSALVPAGTTPDDARMSGDHLVRPALRRVWGIW